MEIYGKTDIGLVRKSNQDAIKLKKYSDDLMWIVVCDGMGGAQGGDVASLIATDKISKSFDIACNNGLKEDENIESFLKSSIINAGNAIYNKAIENKELTGMGTTVVTAFVKKKVLHVAHVGDSRAYIINKSEIKQLTVDHSVVQEMINRGQMTKKEANLCPQKNIITRALGIKTEVYPDYLKYVLCDGDSVLLCTDGLTNELSDEEIYKVFLESAQDKVCDNLINEAKKRKGADNITVAAII